MRRPSIPLPALALAVPLLLAGCGSDRTATPATTGTSSAATPSPSPSPTPRPTSSHTPTITGPLAGFPLDQGYPHENGDDHSPVVITATPATTRFRLCGRTAWDPRAGTTDLVGVKFRGEAEYARGRTLVLYAGADAARLAVSRSRAAVAACTDDPDGQDQGTTHTLVARSLGDQSVVWTDTFYTVNDGERQHDTGLVVYEVVRVGRAVLLAYEYGEGNGTPASRAQSIDRSLREERGLVGRMRRIPHGS